MKRETATAVLFDGTHEKDEVVKVMKKEQRGEVD